MSEYQYITPLHDKPEIARKVYQKKSTAPPVIEEFLKSGVKYAEIKSDVLSKYKSSASCARGFGRIIKSLGHSGKVKVYSDSEKVYLELL